MAGTVRSLVAVAVGTWIGALACAGPGAAPDAPGAVGGVVPAAPATGDAPSAVPDVAGRRAGKGRRSGGGCAPDQVSFRTSSGTVRGIRAVVEAMDPMTHGASTDFALLAGSSAPCEVDLSPLSFRGDAIDFVGWTTDGRGLAFSAGTGDIRAIQILDLERGAVWTGSATETPRVEGPSVVVRRLGARVPENKWPAGCDPQAKGQLTCTSWQEVRWERGEATPTGDAGASLTQ